jgi:Tfp pilus assembly protein PilF
MTTTPRLPHALRPATSPPSPFRSGLARIRFGPGLLALLILACASTAHRATRSPDKIDALVEQGRKALAEKHVAEAQRIFDEAAKQDGNTLRTRMWVIRGWIEEGRVNDALNAIDALDREGAKGPAIDYLYGMAFAYKARGYIESQVGGSAISMSLEDAVQYLDRAVKADPELARDAYVPLAEAAWNTQKLDIAGPAAEQAVARAPKDADAQFLLGRVALARFAASRNQTEKAAESEANWETARKAFTQAAELIGRPEGPSVADKLARIRVDLGHTYVWKDKLEEAQREYAEAISWGAALVNLTQVRAVLGAERFLGAMETAAASIAHHPGAEAPEIATVQWWLGWARYEQKQYEAADQAFSVAVAKWPGYTNSWFYIMLSRYHRRDYEGATAALRRHFDEDPADLVTSILGSPEANLRIVDYLVGWLAQKQRNAEAAMISEIQAAVEPTATRFWNNAGLFWRDAGEALWKSDRPGAAQEAKDAFEKSWYSYTKALEIEPENPALLNDAAVILHYYLDREREKAKAMYEKSFERATAELERTDLEPDVRDLYKTALRDSKNNLAKLARGDKRNE